MQLMYRGARYNFTSEVVETVPTETTDQFLARRYLISHPVNSAFTRNRNLKFRGAFYSA